MNTIPASLLEPGRGWRRYSKDFKAELAEQSRGLGVSMSRVAMAHGINAYLLRRSVVESTGGPGNFKLIVWHGEPACHRAHDGELYDPYMKTPHLDRIR